MMSSAISLRIQTSGRLQKLGLFAVLQCFGLLFFSSGIIAAGTATNPNSNSSNSSLPNGASNQSIAPNSGSPTTTHLAPGAPASAGADVSKLDHLPHPIRGIVRYDGFYLTTWMKVLLGLLILLAGYLLYRWWKNRDVKPKVIPVTPPLDILADRLADMRPPIPFEGKAQEDFFYQLSLFFREFVEEVFKFPASDLTTKELRGPLKSKLPLGRDRISEIIGFLERADMIKFAQAETSLAEANQSLDHIKNWVGLLTPPKGGLTEGLTSKGATASQSAASGVAGSDSINTTKKSSLSPATAQSDRSKEVSHQL